jgi:hypothetical protein
MVYMCVFANFGNFSLRPPVTQGGSSPTGELVLNLVDAWVHSRASWEVALSCRLGCQKPSCGQKAHPHIDSQFWEFFTESTRYFSKKPSEVLFTHMVIDKWIKLERLLGHA